MMVILKQIGVFVISGGFFLWSFTCFISNLKAEIDRQGKEKQEQCVSKILKVTSTTPIKREMIYYPQNLYSPSILAPIPAQPTEMVAGVSAVDVFSLLADSSFLKLLTPCDGFLLMIMWSSGIFFTTASTRLAKRFC